MTSHRNWLIALVVVGGLVGGRTAYAAETLKPAEIRQNLFSTCFVNDREGWVVGELGRVLHTTDGGETFTRSDTGTRLAILSVACVPDGSVVVTGQYGLALRSRDGGATWQKLTTGTERNLLSVAFASAEVGVAVGDYGTIVRTADGGNTWQKAAMPDPIPLPEDIAEIIEPGDVLLYDIDFADAVHGWIVGEFGVTFNTADGGATWSAQKAGVDTTLFGVSFADPQHGWAVGIDQVMVRTVDGGATWESQPIGGRQGFVLALYDVTVKGSQGWAIGDSGLILHSTDAGVTWKIFDVPIQLAANWFRGISLTADAKGFIVGSEGIMLRTEQSQLREMKRKS